jgi:MFS family permease
MKEDEDSLNGEIPATAASVTTSSTRSEMVREAPPRTLDAFLEEAYDDDTNGIKWRFWIVMLSLGVANSSDASEILCLSYILSDAQFQYSILENQAYRASMLASAVFFGMLIGGLFVGTLGDQLGRHPMLMVGLICNSVAGILSAFAANVWQLSALRCIAGLGIGATVPPLFTLVTELAPPSKRGAFITFCASFWMVGSIFVALTALVILEYWGQSWRVFAVACAIPSAVGALMVGTLVGESPRFLAIRQKQGEALRAANKLALQMRYSGELYTNTEMLYNYPAGQQVELFAHITTTNSCAWFCEVVRIGFSDFLRSTSKLYAPQLRQTTWPLQTIWFSLNFGSYGILTWINSLFVAVHLENVYFNALLFAASNLPGNLLSGFLMDQTGRTCMLVSTSLAAAASLMSFAYFAAQESADAEALNASGIVISACSFQAFIIAAWNTIDCITSERFPTSVRSTGMGVCAASGRIGAMIAQIVNGALVGNPVRLLLVASTSLLVGAVTPFLLPSGDFSNRELEDDLDSKNSDSDEETRRLNAPGDAQSDGPYMRVRGYQNDDGVDNKTII